MAGGGVVRPLDGGDSEGQRLAGAGLGLAADVAPGQGGGEREGLDGERFGDALGVQVALCDTAITADAFQNTWLGINQNESNSFFPARLDVSDGNICSQALSVPRLPTLVPPQITPFTSLLNSLLTRTAPVPRFLFLRPPVSWEAG